MLSLNQIIMQGILFFCFPFILLLSSLLLLKTKKKVGKYNNNKVNVAPPSPPKLPFLGHLHLTTSLLHHSFSNLSKKYCPVMLLKLGSVPTLVISSAAAAKEILKVNDLSCCSRPRLTAGGRFSYKYLDIVLGQYGDHWREVRKICVVGLFNARRVQSFQMIRKEEIDVLLNSISQSSSSATPINLSEKFYSFTTNMTTRIAFGKKFRGGEIDNDTIENVIRRATEVLKSFSSTDFFPRVGWIIDWLSGFHTRMEKSFVELDGYFQHVLDYHIKFRKFSECDDEENIVDVLLKKATEDVSKFDADCIKALLMDILLAGVETGANALVWAMTELVKNPKVMKKLQDEIRSCIKEDRVKESDLEKLKYLKVVMKEVLRLHAPAPLLLPRETMSHFKLNGYDIDPKTLVYINVWAIGRDPKLWTNPEEFLPERFIGSGIDYKGHNFELLPFGSGRRICPGMNIATIMMELTLANMLLCFDWKLPANMKSEDVDVEEDSSFVVAKKSPLQLVPICYFNSI